MKALLIYGQLRTANKYIHELSNYINYEKYNHDVYLLINKNDPMFEEDTINLLKSKFNVKMLKYTDDNEYIVERDKYINEYVEISKKISEIKNINCNANHGIPHQYFGRLHLLKLFDKISKENKIFYDKIILTRFDLSYNFEKTMDYTQKLIFVPDLFFCIDSELFAFFCKFFLLENYFQFYGILRNCTSMEEFKIKIKNYLSNNMEESNFNDFYKKWMCMPEANLICYFEENNVKYIRPDCQIIIKK